MGVKQRSCETAYCYCMNSYYWVSSSKAARQPIVFEYFPIIIIILSWESMAAHRTPWSKVVKFGTLVQDSPISPSSKSSEFEVAGSSALAPPTSQSWTCIHFYNFRPIHPILTNKVSFDSLSQAEFNAPYVVVLHHDGFSAILVYVKNLENASPITNLVHSSRNLAHMIFRPDFDRKDAKLEVSQYLSSTLTHQNQTVFNVALLLM